MASTASMLQLPTLPTKPFHPKRSLQAKVTRQSDGPRFGRIACSSSNGRGPIDEDGVKKVEKLIEKKKKKRDELSARIASGEFTVQQYGWASQLRRGLLKIGVPKVFLEPLFGRDSDDGFLEIPQATGSIRAVSGQPFFIPLYELFLSYGGNLAEILEFVMGTGLIPAEEQVWRVRRRAIVPALHQKYVAAMIGLFGEATDRLCQKLDAAASDGEDVEMESLFSRLTLDVIGKAVFNYDFDSLSNDTGIVEVSSKQLRDDLMTMLIAGHETSAAVLTWTFYLLTKEPGVLSKLQDEVDSVLGDRFPTVDDMKKLKYTSRVISESLRLYPQPPVLIRRSLENDILGKFPIKRGEDIFISVWNLHHCPNHWVDAEAFNPERWPLDGPNPNEINQNFSYLPFGGGQRKCIGDMFASFETIVAVAMLVRRFNFQMALGAPPVGMTTGATIHTTEGIKMTITRRTRPPIIPTLETKTVVVDGDRTLSSSTAGAAASGEREENPESLSLLSWVRNTTSTAFPDWNPYDPNPCNWTHITCSPQNVVTQITIQSIQLALPLPSTLLSSLPHLTKLVVSGANLTGPIPDSVGSALSLSLLDLSSNSLTGPIPASLGRLKKLESLFLYDNRLTGPIPPELGGLTSLTELRAGGNRDLSGPIPPELSNCAGLTTLGLADTKISGEIPPELGRLKKLQTLSVYTAMLTGGIPPELGNCSELVNLYLYENSLSGPIPKELGSLSKLSKVLLWQNGLAGEIPEEMGNCTNLVMIDLSINTISGAIPDSFGRLSLLEELLLSDNNVSGSIPSFLSNLTQLSQLQLDTNQMSGLIPPEIGSLTSLTVFFAWDNQLEGSIPSSLANCASLQALDLSHNRLTGSIPPGLFLLRNLTKLLLLSNDLSGPIPPEIGRCASLVRLRLGDNRIGGAIPKEIGGLTALDFLDLSNNRLMVPCRRTSANAPILDASLNWFTGSIPDGLGRLISLNKLVLFGNSLSGPIPASLGHCSGLQLLDLGNNRLSGAIPDELCRIEGLDIALNLSMNSLSGPVPPGMASLDKLSVLDLSYNALSGGLTPLAGLVNLVVLNISHNNFTGYLPDTKLFRQLSATDLAGNDGLCTRDGDVCFVGFDGDGMNSASREQARLRKVKVAIALLITMVVAMVLAMLGIMRARSGQRTRGEGEGDEESSEAEGGEKWPWQFTPFQKLSFSVDKVVRRLVDANVIGKGCSGVVYRVDVDNGETIAVKKLWPSSSCADCKKDDVRDSFSAEVRTLGTIRHKNIVRFLGCCRNKNTRLLMYDYMENGSLGGLLHERAGVSLKWDIRYRIVLGAAQGLAYLHHDCAPPIVHRDIKANNILIGLDFEPYIADFGLAKLVDGEGDFGRSSNTVAGSYGYIAPEYGYMMKITEKSDVYSFGVVVLEVLTGKQPIDPTIPDGVHVVDWVRRSRRSGCASSVEVLDPSLRGRPESEVEEMVQVLGVALLCVNPSPDERPTMKDVAAMLKEIRMEREEYAKVDVLLKGSSSSSSSLCRNNVSNNIFSAVTSLYSSSSQAN
ncbi:hypothetical protein QJS10_CPB18g01781 [Acorus calamus]|uniref:Protein kinase domain-containing protein n=1 Tax=Acorus calamus TaxID=4465 RepID=A0AAV9CN54_ACOCL|nr:hypothetical protein QJS10_CPB18g01781 [Acorus calamus]